MGVRYNAEKKKIGNYFSTPIYSFRCKCHLCDNWFTVVTSGARQKDETWDPAENGGYVISDADSKPADPLAALEKTTEAQDNLTKVQMPRIDALQAVSDHYGSDPFSHSIRVRRRFRTEKKVEQLKRDADSRIRNTYALPEELDLGNDDDEVKQQAQDEWVKGRQEYLADNNAKRRRTEAELGIAGPPSLHGKAKLGIKAPTASASSSSSSLARAASTAVASGAAGTLRARLLQSKARSSDPFLTRKSRPPDLKGIGVVIRK